MVECCGQEMMVADRWLHCPVCGKRLVDQPYGQDQQVIATMVVEYVQDYQPTWNEFGKILHELWREGHYEDYDAVLPEWWKR